MRQRIRPFSAFGEKAPAGLLEIDVHSGGQDEGRVRLGHRHARGAGGKGVQVLAWSSSAYESSMLQAKLSRRRLADPSDLALPLRGGGILEEADRRREAVGGQR